MSFNTWVEVPLNDLCKYISRGISPAYTNNDGVIVLNQKCIRDNRVSYEQSRLTDPDKRKIMEDKYLRKYDILVNSTGVGTLGRVAQIKDIVDKTTVDSHITIVRANENVNPRFLGYNLFLQQSNIEALAEGSTGQTELSRIRLSEAIKVLVPTLEEQEVIANILSCLDDKIELNNRINKNLEEMAQAIFKSWFVDFEQFQDGEFEDSELGRIPKGWKVGTIDDYVSEIKSGGTPNRKTPEYWNHHDVPWIKTGEIRNAPIISSLEYISFEGLKSSSAKILPCNSVLVAMYGATAGKVGLLRFEASTNQACCAMICDSVNKSIYLYLWLLYNQTYIESLAVGAAQQNLSKDTISKLRILIPTDEIINSMIFSEMFVQIENNLRQNQTLSAIRDTLLPKLMSGEIRVPLEEAQ